MLRGLPLFAAILFGFTSAGPCDIYKGGGTPCVAAHSTVRALFDAYTDGLYQVTRTLDNNILNITPLTAGGIANAAAQDDFCKGTTCVISIIYDQSGMGNHLKPAASGGAKKSPEGPALANKIAIMIGGHKAYGVYIESGIGYRNSKTNGIATGDDAQAIYMVVDGKHYNSGCCFDYGNAETDNNDDGAGTMEALYFGSNTVWGHGSGLGPWVMADLEDGLFGCANEYCPNLPSANSRFLVAMLKGRSGGTFALKQGDAHFGELETIYDGPRPKKYTVMKKQGAIILGIGGDNSNWAVGSFYEGVMVKGNPSDDTDKNVHNDIVSVFYGDATGCALP